MSKDERNRRAAKKRKEDPNPDRKGKAKMVTDSYDFSNWRDEFKALEFETVDIIGTEPLKPTEGLGSKMLGEKLDRKTKKDMDDFFRKAFKAPIPHELEETTKYDKYDKEKKQFAKADRKMKFGKFYGKAKEAKDRLRPGEVKRYDKKLGRYVSNKD